MAVYCRQWRSRTGKKRRFNDVVREYIELKHNTIFEEARQFFQALEEKHPDSKNLLKTKTFKEWKKRITNPVEETDDGDESENQQVNNRDEAPTSEPSEQPQREGTDDPDETTTTADILPCLVEELIPSNACESFNQADDIIQGIIQDLEQDQAVRDLLNGLEDDDDLVQPHYQEEDEGIGLNVETELDAILEPFDYDLEVEGFEF